MLQAVCPGQWCFQRGPGQQDFPVAQMIKNLPAMQETRVQFLGQEDPLEKKMATHSKIPAWRIPGERSLAGYSPWGHKSQT